MNGLERLAGPAVASSPRRRIIRYAAAAISAVIAVLYFLIGFGQLYVLDRAAPGASALIFFGVPAGSAFVLGAVLLLATDRKRLWMVGAAFQVFAIVAYVQVAPRRTPPFEMWGILIKLLQLGLLVALACLTFDRLGAGEYSGRGDDGRG